ncbi:MAG: 16S rRNA (guanine(527)-N(7))-methyltransferase RsmG [candidate division WOR-3 bacterium]
MRYAYLIKKWNAKVNLISRKDIQRIFTYHIIDSIAVAPLIPFNARSFDFGSGAGLPGIPLTIIRPDLNMLLIESVKKKCRFLQLAITELNLGNAQVLCERAEVLQPLNCDIILSRLTGPWDKTLRYAVRHLKPSGAIILYKNPNVLEKINEKLLQKLNLAISRTIDLKLPLSSVPRRFVVLNSSSGGPLEDTI